MSEMPEEVDWLGVGMRFVMGVASLVVLIWLAVQHLVPAVTQVVGPALSIFL